MSHEKCVKDQYNEQICEDVEAITKLNEVLKSGDDIKDYLGIGCTDDGKDIQKSKENVQMSTTFGSTNERKATLAWS
ncbi:hypothetical protein LIER_28606 [Lithospermum erythrorhizon]|uniref:Uncharacterized protein n=1 Tax=Lithospermum erythrorhizon TaxID=34254 RepID=A0AAV3RJZ7_LITER